MKTVRGIAINVRHGQNVQTFGHGKTKEISSRNNLVLTLQEGDACYIVEMESSSPIHVDEGDEIIVAGELVNGILEPERMRNLTKGIGGKYPVIMEIILYSIPLGIGLWNWNNAFGLIMWFAIFGYLKNWKERKADRLIETKLKEGAA